MRLKEINDLLGRKKAQCEKRPTKKRMEGIFLEGTEEEGIVLKVKFERTDKYMWYANK